MRSSASRSQTASASLKNTIVPSTSMNRICSGSDIFSLERPNLLLLDRINCFIIFCIWAFNSCTWFVRSTIWFCIPINTWISRVLSILFSCSYVYLNVITRTPIFSTDSDYNRFCVWPPVTGICPFGIMTVDNTSEKPLFYGPSDVLSTMVCRDLFLENEIGQPFVDNHKKSVDRHLFLWFYSFLFSACCKPT